MGHTDVAIGILPLPDFIDMIDSRTRLHDHGKVVCLDAIDGLYGKDFQGKFSSLYETPLSAVSQFLAGMKRGGLGGSSDAAGNSGK
jgi:hypothetical protein